MLVAVTSDLAAAPSPATEPPPHPPSFTVPPPLQRRQGVSALAASMGIAIGLSSPAPAGRHRKRRAGAAPARGDAVVAEAECRLLAFIAAASIEAVSLYELFTRR
ncbi:hypothetical protein VPH35_012915 [Triticum aestivum]